MEFSVSRYYARRETDNYLFYHASSLFRECTLDTRFQIRSLDCLCFVVSAARSENEKKTTVLF